MKTKVINFISWFVASAILIALDRVTKILAVRYLYGKAPVTIIPNVLELLYSENRGAAFGMMQGGGVIFTVIALFVIAAALYVTLRLPGYDDRRYDPLKLCVAMITAGAFGNMADRIAQGYVVDFIYFKPIDFPVFNVADICVTCAAALLIILLVFYYTDDDLLVLSFKKKKKEDES